MFSALLRHDLVRDLVALYQPSQKTMRYVIQLVRGENRKRERERESEVREAFWGGNGGNEKKRYNAPSSRPRPFQNPPKPLPPYLPSTKTRAQTPAATLASSTEGSPPP
jgi:hypothetical protein